MLITINLQPKQQHKIRSKSFCYVNIPINFRQSERHYLCARRITAITAVLHFIASSQLTAEFYTHRFFLKQIIVFQLIVFIEVFKKKRLWFEL